MKPLSIFIKTLTITNKSSKMSAKKSIYDIEINSLQGKPINLSLFKGKKILFVNVASKCGFTPQYKELQKLHNIYEESLVVIGVPCNQFGRQEPGDAFEIQEFCQVNYGVSFLITEKIMVSGKNQHPLYAWLKKQAPGVLGTGAIKWNFTKFLVDRQGNVIKRYGSSTTPAAIAKDIKALL